VSNADEKVTLVLEGADGGEATGRLLANGGLDTLRGNLNLRLAFGQVPGVLFDTGVTRAIDRIIIATQNTVDTGHASRRQGLGSCYVVPDNFDAPEAKFVGEGLDLVGPSNLLGYDVQIAIVPNLNETEFPTANTGGCLFLFLEEGGYSYPVSDPTDANRFLLSTNAPIPPDFESLVMLSMIGDAFLENGGQ
jgi:hypothetical protein